MQAECLSEDDKKLRLEARRADREVFLARLREQKAMVVARMRDGFRHVDRGQVVVGKTHADFVEHGLRSNELGLAGRIFVAGCRRGPKLRGGAGKGVMKDLGPAKLLGLDAGYIEGNREMISLIRIDLDMTFPTTDHAIHAIQAVVDDCALPCMPHLICGAVGPSRIKTIDLDGSVVEIFHEKALIRPHLWIELPYGFAVNAGPNGRAEPKRLLAGVARGINLALLHLGADPAASVFLVRGKNPLSPYLWSAALNNDVWPSLSNWADWVETRTDAETLSRMAAELQSGLGKGPSNVAFSTWQRLAFDILRDAHYRHDPDYAAATTPSTDPDALAALLRERMPLAELDRDPAWSEAAAERILAKVVSYAANAWDPAKAGTSRKPRGTMRHVTEGMTKKKAQAESGRRSAKVKSDEALRHLVGAYHVTVKIGLPPTQETVAMMAGVNRRTAVRRWSEVVDVTIGV